MFVRRKTIKGKTYFYLVKSVRDGEKIRQIYVDYIGPMMPSKRELSVLKRKHEKEVKK